MFGCLSPQTKSSLSASRLQRPTATQEFRFSAPRCDARLLPRRRMENKKKKTFRKRDVKHLHESEVGGKKNKKEKASSAQQTYCRLQKFLPFFFFLYAAQRFRVSAAPQPRDVSTFISGLDGT